MNEDKLRNQLWDIVSREFDEFKKEQLQKSKEEIFENAYKISTLSDFVDMCDPECGCLKINEVKALIKEKYPAHALFHLREYCITVPRRGKPFIRSWLCGNRRLPFQLPQCPRCSPRAPGSESGALRNLLRPFRDPARFRRSDQASGWTGASFRFLPRR